MWNILMKHDKRLLSAESIRQAANTNRFVILSKVILPISSTGTAQVAADKSEEILQRICALRIKQLDTSR